MSEQRRSRHSIFGGIVLVLIGTLFLVQNFHPELDLWILLFRWWPVLLILLGVARLIDYLLAHSASPDAPAPRVVSGGDIFLIIAILALVAVAGGIYKAREKLGDADFWSTNWGNPYVFTDQVSTSQPVAANARIDVSDVRGDISVHADKQTEILVTVKKTVNEFSQSGAQARADAIHYVIVDNHDGSYDIEPQEQGSDSRHIQVDLEVHVPQRASVSASTQQGNIEIAGLAGTIEGHSHKGDIDIRDAGSDVVGSTDHGDVRVSGVAGNVRLSGNSDEVTVSNVQGEAIYEGEFYGPVRMSQIAKGAHVTSIRTDLTVTSVAGSLEIEPADLQVENSSGDVTLTTQKKDIVIEDVAGEVHVDNRDGRIDVRFATPPREPVTLTDVSGDVSITLPAQSNFQIDAESDSGNVDSEFAGVETRKDGDRSILSGQLGTRGPLIHVRTTYGEIQLRKGG
jgi:DUF4097 and DUF4098 domain-containing protein YvlB